MCGMYQLLIALSAAFFVTSAVAERASSLVTREVLQPAFKKGYAAGFAQASKDSQIGVDLLLNDVTQSLEDGNGAGGVDFSSLAASMASKVFHIIGCLKPPLEGPALIERVTRAWEEAYTTERPPLEFTGHLVGLTIGLTHSKGAQCLCSAKPAVACAGSRP
jgi:hypothetical protein